MLCNHVTVTVKDLYIYKCLKCITYFRIYFRCNYDYIEFLDGATGASSLIGRFCGPDLPGSVVSTGNIMHTRFHTDSSVTNTGFKAIYKIG